MDRQYHIKEVCKTLNVTSRTLRYYEEEGLLRSYRTSDHSVRYYTEAELTKMKELLLLRSYGFPIKDMKELYAKGIEITLAMKEQEAKIKKRIDTNTQKLHSIERALTLLKEDVDIFLPTNSDASNDRKLSSEQERIAVLCTEAIGQSDFSYLYTHLSRVAKSVFIPSDNLTRLWQDMINFYGSFINIQGVESTKDMIHITIQLKNLDIPFPIQYIFHGTYIVSIQIGNLTFDARS